MGWQISNEEEEVLQGMHWLAKDVYSRCLRRFMNFDTGEVGRPPKAIGYQMMAETCEFIPDRGSTLRYHKPNRDELRAAIKSLIRHGLVILISKPREQPVYQLPLAKINRASPTATPEKSGYSHEVRGFYPNEEQPKNNQRTTSKEQPEQAGITPIYIDDYRNTQGATSEQPARNSIHQGSALPNLTIPVQIEFDGETLKQIPSSASKWCELFINHFRFDLHEVKTVKVMGMFTYWVDSKLTLAEACIAVEAAEHRLERRPDKPIYYKLFAEQVIKERNNKSKPQGARYGKNNNTTDALELANQQLGGSGVYEHED